MRLIKNIITFAISQAKRMKVTGFTIVRNGVKFDYPFIESIRSVLPLCDEMIVSVGNSEDDTLQRIKDIGDPKIRIIQTVWDDSLREGGRVLAVEKDARCLPALAEIAAAYPGRLEVINADALEIDPVAHLTPPIRVVANLPYNVGTELLVRWLTPESWPPFWESLTLMFQKEVAERIVARPGTKAYGRLAILAQWRAEARIVMTLPPEAFTPPPKIRSAVVHLEALPEPRYPADAKVLSRVVAAAFNQRRKMLRASLKGLAPDIEDRLRSAGLEPTLRAEQVPLEGFCALARALA